MNVAVPFLACFATQKRSTVENVTRRVNPLLTAGERVLHAPSWKNTELTAVE
jgi:hypothetical protein